MHVFIMNHMQDDKLPLGLGQEVGLETSKIPSNLDSMKFGGINGPKK